MLIRNSEAISLATKAVRNVDISVEFDVPPIVSMAIEAFNKAVDARLSGWVTTVDKPLFTVLTPVNKLNRNDRDTFESTLFSYAGWNVIAGDRNSTLFGIASDYTQEELNTFLMNYLIYNGRFCYKCKEFTEYKSNKGVWACPVCGDKVGCHGGSDIAFGSVANQATANIRRKLHVKIDTLWKEGILTRTEVYENISSLLGVHRCYAHVAMLGYNQCKLVDKWATAMKKFGESKCQEKE